MSETPRSDKAAFRVPAWDDLRVVEGLTEVVPLAVAQNLERENADLRAKLAEAETLLRALLGQIDKFAEENGEADFYTGDARTFLRLDAARGGKERT